MMASTAADVLIDTIEDWGVDVVFGLPGDGINGGIKAEGFLGTGGDVCSHQDCERSAKRPLQIACYFRVIINTRGAGTYDEHCGLVFLRLAFDGLVVQIVRRRVQQEDVMPIFFQVSGAISQPHRVIQSAAFGYGRTSLFA